MSKEHSLSTYDLLVIGGGINGMGIAADAAGRGLSVCVCDRDDIGHATSSASSKLIHGGLRYLEQFDFGLVRKSLIEQHYLLQNAPHLVKPQAFFLPHCPWLRPYWMIRLGLFFYDHLSRQRHLPKSYGTKHSLALQALHTQYQRGFQFFDCRTDDSRLVCHVALLAAQHGAVINPRHEVTQTHRTKDHWQLTLQNHITGLAQEVRAKCIVNAAGPWVESVASHIVGVPLQQPIQLVKGSHLIVPKLASHNQAYLLQNQDQRVIFVIPFANDFHLIGTTDIPVNKPESLNVTQQEKEYLCQSVNRFMKQPLTPSDIVHTFWGVRTLQQDSNTSAQRLSRDFSIEVDTELAPCVHIIGGKLTTYRALSEYVVDQLQAFFHALKPRWTAHAKLPGADGPSLIETTAQLRTEFSWLPHELSQRLLDNYGHRALHLLDSTTSLHDLGECFGGDLFQREVDFLCQNEWAYTAEDILWRRTKLGLRFTSHAKERLTAYLQQPALQHTGS